MSKHQEWMCVFMLASHSFGNKGLQIRGPHLDVKQTPGFLKALNQTNFYSPFMPVLFFFKQQIQWESRLHSYHVPAAPQLPSNAHDAQQSKSSRHLPQPTAAVPPVEPLSRKPAPPSTRQVSLAVPAPSRQQGEIALLQHPD